MKQESDVKELAQNRASPASIEDDSSRWLFRQYLGPLLSMAAAFVVYYSMHGFRKPFGAGEWPGFFMGTAIQQKTALAVSQIMGYALAKLIGTRLCSGLKYERLVWALLGCMLAALAALFALPFLGHYMFVAMFFNGLSLGMVWGFVMRPLEGRAMTEMLIAGLCISFIIASGDVKSMGKWLMQTPYFISHFGGNEAWMPFVTALVYLPPLLVGAWVLFLLPRPTVSDQHRRSRRDDMSAADRRRYLAHHATVLLPLGAAYFLLTAYRDFRDTFQAEIFLSLQITDASAFSSTERCVALGVVAVLSVFILLRDSRLAFVACHWVMAGGLVFCGLATYALKIQRLDGYGWMVAAGTGAYVCYIAFHCILFERMVAYTRSPGNAVFAMMMMDFVGYIAAILLMIASDFFQFFQNVDHLDVLVGFTWLLTVVGAGSILVSLAMVKRLKVLNR